jgi:hypothetical protein
VGVGGPDDSWRRSDAEQPAAEDSPLPEHEQDARRRMEGEGADDDPAEVAAVADTGAAETDLPAHEDDRRRGTDTGTAELNP